MSPSAMRVRRRTAVFSQVAPMPHSSINRVLCGASSGEAASTFPPAVFIIIGLSGSAEAELVKKQHGPVHTVVSDMCSAVLRGAYDAFAYTREKHSTAYSLMVCSGDGTYRLHYCLIPAGYRRDALHHISLWVALWLMNLHIPFKLG